MPRPYSHLKKDFFKKLIQFKTYVRIKLEKGQLIKEVVEIHGRKLLLDEIR